MPRIYKRKNLEKKLVTEEQMIKAKKLIEIGKSKRFAAHAVGISEGSLRKRLKLNSVSPSLGRYRPTFTEVQELEFVYHCKKMSKLLFGLSISDIRRMAYEFAEENEIIHRFDKNVKMAGRDWLDAFLKRHPDLCLYITTSPHVARVIDFDKVSSGKIHKILGNLYDKYKFKSNRIYDMGETRLYTVAKQPLINKNIGDLVTVICCTNVIGHFIPPAFIYPRKEPRDNLLDGGPLECICMVSDNGDVNPSLFLGWLHHFKDFSYPSRDDPVLLLMDNHFSYIDLDAIEYARSNGIVIVTLSIDNSCKYHPLHRTFFIPLKTCYAVECDKWVLEHPDVGMSQYEVAQLFNAAYKQVATISNVESGFKTCGVYPFDENALVNSDLEDANSVTEQILVIDVTADVN